MSKGNSLNTNQADIFYVTFSARNRLHLSKSCLEAVKTFLTFCRKILSSSSFPGKLKPNVVMMGFKNNWITDPEGCESFTKVIHHCFEINLSVAILKLRNGCDFSNKIKSEKPITVTVTQGERPNAEVDLDMLEDLATEEDDEDVGKQPDSKEKKKKPKTKKKKDMPAAVLLGSDGRPLPANVVREINMFKVTFVTQPLF